MPQIAIRLDDNELGALDRLVAEGGYPSRAAAVRTALSELRRAAADREVAGRYAQAYGATPQTVDEERLAVTGADLLGALYGDEPPYPADGGADLALSEIRAAAERILAAVGRSGTATHHDATGYDVAEHDAAPSSG